jgi:hypothetical protein
VPSVPAAAPTPSPRRADDHRLPVLAAYESVLADPVRLVQVLQDAVDDDDALDRVAEAFGLDREQATVVLDAQFRLLLPSRREALAEEVRVQRTPWREPLQVAARLHGRRRATLVLDGTEHSFRAGGLPSLLDQLTDFLRAHVVRPDLRPVLLTTGLPDGPSRITLWPSGSAEYEYPEDPDTDEGRRPGPDDAVT